MALQLWKYNTTTGYWKIERGVTPETKDEWLRIFEKDDPNGSYVVSASRPTKSGKPGRVKLTDAARRSRLHRALDAAMDAQVERVLYGIPKGKTERYEEVLLLSNATDEKIAKVKILAARDGFHSFRVASINLSAPPNFAKTVRR